MEHRGATARRFTDAVITSFENVRIVGFRWSRDGQHLAVLQHKRRPTSCCWTQTRAARHRNLFIISTRPTNSSSQTDRQHPQPRRARDRSIRAGRCFLAPRKWGHGRSLPRKPLILFDFDLPEPDVTEFSEHMGDTQPPRRLLWRAVCTVPGVSRSPFWTNVGMPTPKRPSAAARAYTLVTYSPWDGTRAD